MKLLHMADVHLGMEPDKGKPWGDGRARQLWDAFTQAVEAAEEHQVDLVLIAGDLFHRQPLKRELKEVNEILSRLTRAKVVIMAGNHDYLSRNSFYRSFSWNENIFFLKSENLGAIEFTELSTAVYGFSYEHREIRDRLSNIISADMIPVSDGTAWRAKKGETCGCIDRKPGNEYHILLAHGGDENHVPFTVGELEQMDFHYIALGHIHKPGQLKENRIVMAGSLQPLDHTERGPRGYWITELKRGAANTVFYPIRMCEYRGIELELERDTTNYRLLQQARDALEGLSDYQLAVLTLTGMYDPETPPDVERLSELPGVVDVELLCRPGYDFEKLKQEYRDQIVGRYIRELEGMPQDEAVRRALYLGVDALLGNT